MATIRVLVVDDVTEMREVLRLTLEAIADVKSVISAANAVEARLEISRRRPDLVVLDEVLPGESSLDLVAELEKDAIAVILVTGMRDRVAPLPSGAAVRLVKPEGKHPDIDQRRFREAIKKIFP